MTPTLTKDHKRTLAVIGRFNTDPATPVLVFDSSDPDVANLSAADVWEKLKPELGQTEGDVDLSCGGFAYAQIGLSRPVAGAESSARPVPLDSMLLEQASSPGKTQQTIGGELVAALLRDLDVVARFAGHRFPNALLEVARRYLIVDARPKSRNQMVGQNQINRLVANPVYADGMVRVLTAYEADLSRAERELRLALSNGAPGESKSPLKAQGSVKPMVDAIVASLRKLRLEVLGAGSEPDDKSWRVIMGIVPPDEATADHMAWVNEMNSRGEYGFEVGTVAGVRCGGTLTDYYNLYMEHSANLHRFVRSPILHSHVFLWLMSKYAPILGEDTEAAAEMAYRMGVEGAGDDRIFGESEEKVKERRKGVFRGSDDFLKSKRGEPDLKPEEREFLKKLRDYQDMLNEAVFSHVFRDARRFTREELLEMLEILFAEAVDVTSGKLSDILRDTIKFGMKYQSLYQALLGILESETEPAEKITEIRKLAEREEQEGRKAALSSVADGLEEIAKTANDGDEFREGGLDTFSRQVGHSVTKKFIEESLGSRTELESSTQANRDLYFLASILGGRMGKVHDLSAESVLVPMSADSKRIKRTEDAVKKQVEFNATSAARSAASVTLPLPEGLKAAVGGEGRGLEVGIRVKPVTTKEQDADQGAKPGKRVGTVKISSSEQRIDVDEGIVYELADGDAPELEYVVSSAGGDVDAAGGGGDGGTEGEEVKISDPDMEGALGEVRRILEDGKKRYARTRKIHDRVGELSKYAELREQLRLISAGLDVADLDEVVRATVRRRLFALTFGEIIAASPDSESFLGKQDISQTLALMLEIVKELGDRTNKNLADAKPDDESDKALGPREKGGPRPKLNLSRFFRVPNDEEEGREVIQNAMDYHQYLCESVQGVMNQLEDMRDLRAIADGMSSDTRLVIINRTFDEYANEVESRVRDWHFSFGHHPSVVYFPKCADVHNIADSDPSQPRGGKTAWELLKDTFAARRFQTIEGEVMVPSCPLIVTADQEDEVLRTCPFPAMRLGSLGGIGFCARPGRGAIETESVGGSSSHGRIEFETNGLIVEGSRYFLSMPAAMTLAVFAENDGVLGRLSDDIASHSFMGKFKEISGVEFPEKGRVLPLLRRFWVDGKQGDGCLSEFILARLSSLMLQWMGETGYRQDDSNKNKPFIHEVLAESRLAAPGETVVNDDPAIGTAQREFLAASFWPAMPFTNIAFFNDKGCKNDISKQGANCRIFGLKCEATVKCVLANVGGSKEREIELLHDSRQKLGFLYEQA